MENVQKIELSAGRAYLDNETQGANRDELEPLVREAIKLDNGSREMAREHGSADVQSLSGSAGCAQEFRPMARARLRTVDHGDSPHARDACGVGILTGRTPKAYVTTGTGSAT